MSLNTEPTLGTSAYSPKATPLVSGHRSGQFLQDISLYNATTANLRGFRQAAARIRAGNLVTFCFIGDSKVAGIGTNNGNSLNAAASMPGAFRTALAGRGYAIAGTGVVHPFQNPATGTQDTRWTFTGTWSPMQNTPNVNFLSSSTVGSTAVFTSDMAGTIVEIYTLSNSAAFTYSIDGAAAVTVTPSGSNVIYKTTVTGLSNATHTVTINVTQAATTYVLGAGVRGATGLLIDNHGISGSQTSHWTATMWYQAKAVAESLPSDAVFISLGINDSGSSVPTSTFKANMTTIANAHLALGRPVMIILPTAPQSTHVAYPMWPQYIAAHYDLADSLGVPLLDLTDIQGTWDQANNAGMMQGSVHENEKGYALNAEALLTALYR